MGNMVSSSRCHVALCIQLQKISAQKRKRGIMLEVVLQLSRLNCQGCVRRVTQALQVYPDVEILGVDIPTKTVRLRYAAEQVSLEQVQEALAEARYPVVITHLANEKGA